MSVALQFQLTQAGQAAAWNATNTGIALALTHIQFGTGNRAPTGTETALVAPVQAVPIAAGFVVSPSQIRMSAIFSGSQNYPINEVGLWAGAPAAAGSVLVGYWSQVAGTLAYKSAGVDFVLAHDMTLNAAVGAGSLTILADSGQSALLALIMAHEAKADPHPQYTTVPEVQALIAAGNGEIVLTSTSANVFVGATSPAITNNSALAIPLNVKFPAPISGAATINLGGGNTPLVDAMGVAFSASNTMPAGIAIVDYDPAMAAYRVLGVGGIDQVARNTASAAQSAAGAAQSTANAAQGTASAAQSTADAAQVMAVNATTLAGTKTPIPTEASGVGQVVFFQSVAYTLPAGGTWLVFGFGMSITGNVNPGSNPSGFGLKAGGSFLDFTGNGGQQGLGFAWRIA